MANFVASFEGGYYNSRTTHRLFDYSKDEAVRVAKRIADEGGYTSIYLVYMGSEKTVGWWEKKGSRWYKV